MNCVCKNVLSMGFVNLQCDGSSDKSGGQEPISPDLPVFIDKSGLQHASAVDRSSKLLSKNIPSCRGLTLNF